MNKGNIIVVQNVFDDLELTEQSIKSIRYAAHRWKADFYEMCYFKHEKSPSVLFWDRMWAMKNFEKYDRVLIVDPDVIINENAPNIFELMDENDDVCVVHNINEDRISTPYLKEVSDTVCKLHNSLLIFEKYIPNFSEQIYLEKYFNMGVFLYKPKRLEPIIIEMNNLIYNNEELYRYFSYIDTKDWFASQNFTSGYLTHSDLNIKFLPKEWNWLAPDIHTECNDEFYWGQMKPHIYHFTGTNLAKDRLRTYTKWRKNG
jgi:lipopolysaccharide biosynthesis glycosyltransferase